MLSGLVYARVYVAASPQTSALEAYIENVPPKDKRHASKPPNFFVSEILCSPLYPRTAMQLESKMIESGLHGVAICLEPFITPASGVTLSQNAVQCPCHLEITPSCGSFVGAPPCRGRG
jgi:hypothetical protein